MSAPASSSCCTAAAVPRAGLVRRQPRGAAEAGLMAGDVVKILDAERKSGERAAAGTLQRGVGVRAKSAERIVGKIVNHF